MYEDFIIYGNSAPQTEGIWGTNTAFLPWRGVWWAGNYSNQKRFSDRMPLTLLQGLIGQERGDV